MRNAFVGAGLFVMLAVPGIQTPTVVRAEESPTLAADKAALAPLQIFVGQWRGVGLPKRGSNQGAWSEQAEWTWHFADGHAELVGELNRDKYFERLQIQPGETAEQFVVLGTPAGAGGDAEQVRFVGTLEDGVLQAVAAQAAADSPARITVKLVADGDRMLTLFERQLSEDTFGRLAEVGSTRKGSGFAKAAASGPECVVTGGLGTIPVEFEGKTYYVCCGGCKDLFEEDPAGTLADYRERKAAERAEKNAAEK